jgi:hypothetical protein
VVVANSVELYIFVGFWDVLSSCTDDEMNMEIAKKSL